MTLRELARTIAARFADAGIPDAALEAEVIVRHAAGVTRAAYFAGAPASEDDEAAARALASRRLERVPLAYLTGSREFYGLEFSVTPDVLIPRPETEALVDLARDELRAAPGATVVDVGTGGGCIAVALAVHHPRARITGIDRSRGALRVAQANARKHGADVGLAAGDLAQPIGAADIVIANLPYVPRGRIATLEPEVGKHEPRLALDGGPEGTDLLARLLDDCGGRLQPRLLALEVDASHAGAVADHARRAGACAEVRPDPGGLSRYVVARWK